MFLILVLLVVGGVSVGVAHAIEQGIGHRHLLQGSHSVSSASKWTTRSALVTVSLTLAVFIPLLAVTYVALGLVGHALGR